MNATIWSFTFKTRRVPTTPAPPLQDYAFILKCGRFGWTSFRKNLRFLRQVQQLPGTPVTVLRVSFQVSSEPSSRLSCVYSPLKFFFLPHMVVSTLLLSNLFLLFPRGLVNCQWRKKNKRAHSRHFLCDDILSQRFETFSRDRQWRYWARASGSRAFQNPASLNPPVAAPGAEQQCRAAGRQHGR